VGGIDHLQGLVLGEELLVVCDGVGFLPVEDLDLLEPLLHGLDLFGRVV
jgi:hypothetical protein